MGTRKKVPNRRLWLVCRHLLEGTADEAGLRPDRIAMCKECAIAGSASRKACRYIMDDAEPMCAVCLYDKLTTDKVEMWGREYLVRDVAYGHTHGAAEDN
jgi:hypothetical protein